MTARVVSPSTGRTRARALLVIALAVATSAARGAGVATPDPRTLLHQYKCDLCHADDAPKAGPAFRDVAAAYRARHVPASSLAKVIIDGQRGGGPWHMPPHPEVSRAEADAIARYILALH